MAPRDLDRLEGGHDGRATVVHIPRRENAVERKLDVLCCELVAVVELDPLAQVEIDGQLLVVNLPVGRQRRVDPLRPDIHQAVKEHGVRQKIRRGHLGHRIVVLDQ